jgi:VanZ family protein
MKNSIKYNSLIRPYAPYIFWGLIALVTKLLLMEYSGSLPSFPHSDKVIHACLFAMITLTGYLAYANYSKWLYTSLIIYGAITEIMQQMFTATRFASVYDWLADVIGVLLAVFVIKIIINNFKSKLSYAN